MAPGHPSNMGRRSEHTAHELREMILQATTELIESDGLAGVSAREIARKIEYSPGTLYNAFRNLDDVILTLEARMLDELQARLEGIPLDGNPQSDLQRIGETYVAFSSDNAQLWNLLFQHQIPNSEPIPDWYRAKLDGLTQRLEVALAPLLVNAKPTEANRAASVLWAGVHGIASLSTAEKLTNITKESAALLVSDLISHYLDGMSHRLANGRS
ncbi:MAG: TetR/AcrR family transcriptional regulator [Hyphomicrobiaceae bacterium]|nr:TetR/AcrR family transcriptional regulator [Hyphomicrobiaceae bacterium]